MNVQLNIYQLYYNFRKGCIIFLDIIILPFSAVFSRVIMFLETELESTPRPAQGWSQNSLFLYGNMPGALHPNEGGNKTSRRHGTPCRRGVLKIALLKFPLVSSADFL